MADKTEFDWGDVNGQAVERLRAPKVAPVPEPVVRQAQRSWDEQTGLAHTFKTPEMAEAFAKLVRKAGQHTIPRTTVYVVIDPDNDGNTARVSWKAGKRRGRKSED